MATAGGLIIGAVGLGTLYTTCVECYTVFHKIRAFNRDSGYLASKLETENALFRRWGERVGLLSRDKRAVDSRLREPWTRKAVEGVLSCVHILLTDTDKFQTTYGLVPFAPTEAMSQTRSSSSKHVRRYSQPQSWPSEVIMPERKHIKILRKFHWSILDQEKFNDLITELRDHVQRLDELVPPKGDVPESRAVKDGVPELSRSSGSSGEGDRSQRIHRGEIFCILPDSRKQKKPLELMPPACQWSDRALTIRPKPDVEEIAPPLTKEIWNIVDHDNHTTHRYYRIT